MFRITLKRPGAKEVEIFNNVIFYIDEHGILFFADKEENEQKRSGMGLNCPYKNTILENITGLTTGRIFKGNFLIEKFKDDLD